VRLKSKEEFSIYMAMVSNPMRKRVLEVLSSFPSLPFLRLMSECHLSHPSHCGVFTYHLKKLVDEGAVSRRSDEYSLTSKGRDWVKLTEKMEGEYMKDGSEEKEFSLEKWCPFCLEANLKAKVTREIIRMKCKNPKCIIGGPIEKPPFYFAMPNEIPDWREKGLDIFDLVHRIVSKVTPERKIEIYRLDLRRNYVLAFFVGFVCFYDCFFR
jgi:predicted transcriptional regulator